MEALARIAFVAGTAPTARAAAEQVGEELVRLFGAGGVSVYLAEPAAGGMAPLFRTGTRPEEARSFDAIAARDSISARVMADGQARSWQVGDYPEAARPHLAATRYQAVASVPLRSRSRVLGALNLGFAEPRRLTAEELRLLEAAAAHVAAAVEALGPAGAPEAARAAQAELARAQAQQARQAHLASLGELTALVAHELRHPLGVLTNVVALLRDRAPDEGPRRELLRSAQQELDRMGALVVGLLEFGRPAAGPRARGGLGPLLREVLEAARRLPAAGPVAIELELAEGLPAIEHDPRALFQALLNLAANALEAMGGSGRLTLRAGPSPGGVRLEVADTGPGFAPEALAHLFEPFFTTKATGTGLGLVLVRRVAEAHGGTLEVRSAPGAGTVVGLELPA